MTYGVLALRTREERKSALETSRERAIKLAQANEVLRRSVNALARYKNLQGFVDQVLVVITEQLGGHSSSLWLIDLEQRKGYLRSICQNGRVVAGEQSDHPNAHEPDFVFQDGRVMTPTEANYPERLRSIPLDERLVQAGLAIQLTRLANSAKQSAGLAERNELAGGAYWSATGNPHCGRPRHVYCCSRTHESLTVRIFERWRGRCLRVRNPR